MDTQAQADEKMSRNTCNIMRTWAGRKGAGAWRGRRTLCVVLLDIGPNLMSSSWVYYCVELATEKLDQLGEARIVTDLAPLKAIGHHALKDDLRSRMKKVPSGELRRRRNQGQGAV